MNTPAVLSLLFLICLTTRTVFSQNLVPNPGFETTSGCVTLINPAGLPVLDCLDSWNAHSFPLNPAMSDADLVSATGVVFPPSTIASYEGDFHIGLYAGTTWSEYVQVELTQPMTAGQQYCVSYYVSVQEQTALNTTTIGAYFSTSELTVNPYAAGLSAHVQGPVPPDPTSWTKITETYTATGGEQFLTMGGFENAAITLGYFYIDLVEVHGCASDPSAPVTEDGLFCPNAFSPNGDLTNDRFGATGENISEFELTVYNRWGEQVFYSPGIDEWWDGTYGGRPAKQDIYAYTIVYRNSSGKRFISGHVALVR